MKLTVTDVRNAAKCPRLFVLAHKRRRTQAFIGEGPKVGGLVHHILDEAAQRIRSDAELKEELGKNDIELEEIADLLRDRTYSVYYNTILRERIRKPQAILRSWEMVEKACYFMAQFLYSALSASDEPNVEDALHKTFLGAEWSFQIPVKIGEHNIILSGRTDWLSYNAETNEIVVWDFKTSPSSDTDIDLSQLAMYSYAIEEELGVNSAPGVIYLAQDEVKLAKFDPGQIREIRGRVLSQLVQMKGWIQHPSSAPFPATDDFCPVCRLRGVCEETFGPPSDVAVEPAQRASESDDESSMLAVPAEIPPEADTKPSEDTGGTKGTTGTSEAAIYTQPLESKEGEMLLGNAGDQPFCLPVETFIRHGAILGATGSGKTVLAKVIIEEALKCGKPALLIDPQGDLCSLALANDEIGEQLIGRTRIKIFTPGSEKGVKLSLNPLKTPSPKAFADDEYALTLLDNVSTTLLTMLGYSFRGGIPAEKALLEAVLKDVWQRGDSLDFAGLADQIESVAEIESVVDGKQVRVDQLIVDRKKGQLCQKLVTLGVGTEGTLFHGGEALEIDEMMENAPALFIVNLAGLGTDVGKRQVVVSWTLREVYDWMLLNPQRAQDSVRMFFYIDEVADFLPPHPHSPPSKKMLMLLLRQARKYGCACLFATQSPASIDYKAMDNVGTLFVGKIPSEQSARKIEPLIQPFAERCGKEAKGLVALCRSAEPGSFLTITTAHQEPVMFKSRWPYTRHETLSLDDIAGL